MLLIDRLDCIGGKAESASKQMEARLVAQLASCCDGNVLSFPIAPGLFRLTMLLDVCTGECRLHMEVPAVVFLNMASQPHT